MPSADLTWTQAESPVNLIQEYRIFRSVSVLTSAPGFADSFNLLDTGDDLLVVRDPNPPFGVTHPLTYSDDTVNFGTDTYCYRVDSVSVLVGEATGGSPQTGVGPSNIVCLGTPPGTSVLTASKAGADGSLSWTASTPALNTIDFYTVSRSVNGGAFSVLAVVNEPTLIYLDTTTDFVNNEYDYFVKATDEAGVQSDDSNIASINFTEEFYIACADSGAASQRIMTSSDGLTWVGQTIVDDTYESLAHAPDLGPTSDGRLVVLSLSGGNNIKTSDDAGFSWTTRSTPNAGTLGWLALAYSPDLTLFAAISSNDNTDGSKIMTSPDGINWTRISTPAAADDLLWQSLEWVPEYGFFLATGNNDVFDMPSLRSTDGITWTYSASLGISARHQATSPAGLTVCANGGDASNMISSDGISFTQVGPPNGTMAGFVGVGFGVGVFVFGQAGSVGFWTSPDGVTWSGPHNIPASHDSCTFQDIKFADEAAIFVTVGQGNALNQAMISSDGVVWTGASVPVTGSWREVLVATKGTAARALQELVMVESNPTTNEAVLSVDGGNIWVDNDSDTDRLECVAYSPTLDIFAALGDNTASSSPDGITWTSRTAPNAKTWQTIIWSADLALFIAGADDTGTTNLATSPDGINWTVRTTPANTSVAAVAAAPSGNNQIMGGRHTNTPVGDILHSTDGITWANPTGAHAASRVVAVTYDTFRSRFVAVETLGKCNISTTGASGWSLNINTDDLGTGWTAGSCNMTYSAVLDMLIMVGTNGIWRSVDGGANWTQSDISVAQDVLWSDTNNKFYACNTSAPRLQSSTDGISWTDHVDPAGVTGPWRGIAAGATV